MNNEYEKNFYEYEKIESQYDFKKVYYLPELKSIVENYIIDKKVNNVNIQIKNDDLKLLKNEISKLNIEVKTIKFKYIDKLNSKDFNESISDSILRYFNSLNEYYKARFNIVNEKKDEMIYSMQESDIKKKQYEYLYNNYFNSEISKFAQNSYSDRPVVRINNNLIQKIDPIYLDPQHINFFSYRTHFLAPRKFFFGRYFDTFYINIFTICCFTLILYIFLYFEIVKKFLKFAFKIKLFLNQLKTSKKEFII